MTLRTWGSKITVAFKDKACQNAYKYHGYFCIVSNKEKDCFEALRKYRSRETIESFFEPDVIALSVYYTTFRMKMPVFALHKTRQRV